LEDFVFFNGNLCHAKLVETFAGVVKRKDEKKNKRECRLLADFSLFTIINIIL
jgi:hypothetical protein